MCAKSGGSLGEHLIGKGWKSRFRSHRAAQYLFGRQQAISRYDLPHLLMHLRPNLQRPLLEAEVVVCVREIPDRSNF